jgi:hypothetical protein
MANGGANQTRWGERWAARLSRFLRSGAFPDSSPIFHSSGWWLTTRGLRELSGRRSGVPRFENGGTWGTRSCSADTNNSVGYLLAEMWDILEQIAHVRVSRFRSVMKGTKVKTPTLAQRTVFGLMTSFTKRLGTPFTVFVTDRTYRADLFHHFQAVCLVTDFQPAVRDNGDLIGAVRSVPVSQDGPRTCPKTIFSAI